MQVDVLTSPASILGESPIWCGRTQRLYWIDTRGPAFHVFERNSGTYRSHDLPETTGSICLCEDGSLLAAMTTGVFRLSPNGSIGDAIAVPEPNHPDNRFNDGRCDRFGRLWVGTMNDIQRVPSGALWRLGPKLDFTWMLGDIIVPNSLAFSPENDRMYLADTYRHTIHVFDYDGDEGTIRNKRMFSDMNGWTGRPDGSAIDAEGCLWNAEYAGGRIVRYTPDGRIDRVVPLPVTQPSCCAFGGPDLDELYITTARQRLSPEQLDEQPLAGRLFVVRPGVKGLDEGRFAG